MLQILNERGDLSIIERTAVRFLKGRHEGARLADADPLVPIIRVAVRFGSEVRNHRCAMRRFVANAAGFFIKLRAGEADGGRGMATGAIAFEHSLAIGERGDAILGASVRFSNIDFQQQDVGFFCALESDCFFEQPPFSGDVDDDFDFAGGLGRDGPWQFRDFRRGAMTRSVDASDRHRRGRCVRISKLGDEVREEMNGFNVIGLRRPHERRSECGKSARREKNCRDQS